jgi:hypothetical protein
MPARRLPTRRLATVLAGAVETTWIHRVAGRTGDRTALVTTRRDRNSLWSSVAMRTGNGSYDFAIRRGCSDNCTGRSADEGLHVLCEGQSAS